MDEEQNKARSAAWVEYDPPGDLLDRAIKGDPIAAARAIQQAYKTGFDDGVKYARQREFESY